MGECNSFKHEKKNIPLWIFLLIKEDLQAFFLKALGLFVLRQKIITMPVSPFLMQSECPSKQQFPGQIQLHMQFLNPEM